MVDLPMLWFFLPPPGDVRRLDRTSDRVRELYPLVRGREDQLDLLYDRFRELSMPEPAASDVKAVRVIGAPTAATLGDYRNQRKEMLLALLDDDADQVNASAEEMGRFFDHLRQVGIRGFVAEHAGDPDYTPPPKRSESRTKAQDLTRLSSRTAGRTVSVMSVVKRSVSFDEGVWDDLEREVGSRPVSQLVNDALALYLRRQRGLAAVAAYEAEQGELTDAELAAADALLDDAGLADLRTAEAPAKPRKRPAAKKASAPRRSRE